MSKQGFNKLTNLKQIMFFFVREIADRILLRQYLIKSKEEKLSVGYMFRGKIYIETIDRQGKNLKIDCYSLTDSRIENLEASNSEERCRSSEVVKS